LLLSITVLLTGFLGVGVRAFASAVISYSIFFAALGIVLVILPLFFAIRQLRARRSMDRKILQIPIHAWPRRDDRRRPPARGQARAAVANERRSEQLAGFSRPKSVSMM
jgi:hypothetical protein